MPRAQTDGELKLSANTMLALCPTCTHQGSPKAWSEQKQWWHEMKPSVKTKLSHRTETRSPGWQSCDLCPIARPASLHRLSSCFINGIFSCLQGDARGHPVYVSDTSSFDNVAVFDIQEIGTGQPAGVGLWAFICRWKLVSKYEKWSCWSAVFGHLRDVLQNEIHGGLLSLKPLLSFQCHGSLFTQLAQNSNSCWTRNLIRSRLCSEFCCKWHILTDTFILCWSNVIMNTYATCWSILHWY